MEVEDIRSDMMVGLELSSEDRISRLPVGINHQILLLIPRKEAARLCLLSKTWRKICLSFPVLTFHQSDFVNDLGYQDSKDGSKVDEFLIKRRKFMEFVDKSLKRFQEQNLRMKKLSVLMDWAEVESDGSFLNAWLRLAAECAVEELELELCGYIETTTGFMLPQCAFVSECLTVLKLRGNIYVEQVPFKSNHRCRLRVVSFSDVTFSDDAVFQDIISSCPLLEYIALKSCLGLKHVNLSGFDRLKEVIMTSNIFFSKGTSIEEEFEEEFLTAEIGSPSIETITCAYMSTSFHHWRNMEACCNLRELIMRDYSLVFTTSKFQDLFRKFPLLEHLQLSCVMADKIEIQNDRLRTLKLRHCRSLTEASIDCPNTHFFMYEGEDMPLFSFLRASSLLELEIILSAQASLIHHVSWFVNFSRFLGHLGEHLSRIKNLKVEAVCSYMTFDETMSKKFPFHSIFNLKQLELCFHTSGYQNSLSDFLDGLLWFCHPTILIVKSYNDKSLDFIKSLPEMLSTRCSHQLSSASNHPECWSYYLKDAVAETCIEYDKRPEPYHWVHPRGYLSIKLDWQ